MNSNLQCPVDFITINEHKARINAFFVALSVTIFLLSGWLSVVILLAVDFFMRAGSLAKYSALGFLSDAIIKWLKIGHKPVDRAPKRFAAWVGCVFSIGIMVLSLLSFFAAAQIAAGVLILFAVLESFFGFCAGCYIYTALMLMMKKTDR